MTTTMWLLSLEHTHDLVVVFNFGNLVFGIWCYDVMFRWLSGGLVVFESSCIEHEYGEIFDYHLMDLLHACMDGHNIRGTHDFYMTFVMW
jgi:hypothetical protein